MSTALSTQNQAIIQSLVINGDLSKLDANMKVAYYQQYCDRLGLDPFTQPFKLLKLNGKEILYCDRSGAQQLNKLHNVSHEIKTREVLNDCYVVTARATANGRIEESIGAVPIAGLKGEGLCNAYMKAETKAKRRSTLDLLGLGILDESEIGSIPGAVPMSAPIDVTPPPANTAPVSVPPTQPPAPKTGVTEAAFKAICDRLKAKEVGIYEKAIAAFNLTDAQLTTLNTIRSQSNSVGNGTDNTF
jgi:hypothetical protein